MYESRGRIVGNRGRVLAHLLKVADGSVDSIRSVARSLLGLALQLVELVEQDTLHFGNPRLFDVAGWGLQNPHFLSTCNRWQQKNSFIRRTALDCTVLS